LTATEAIAGPRRISREAIWDILCAALLVGVSAWFGIELARAFGDIAVVWIANGILLAFLLTSPTGRWPALLSAGFVADMAAHMIAGGAPLSAAGLVACHTLQVLIAGLALHRRFADQYARATPLFFVRFLACGVVLAPALADFAASVAVSAATGDSFGHTFGKLFLADAMGIAAVTPLAVKLRTGEILRLLKGKDAVWAMAILAVVAAASAAVFYQSRYPGLFVVLSILVLVAFRLGRAGLAIATCVSASIAIAATLHGLGPVGDMTATGIEERIHTLQFFVFVAVLTAYPIAIALEERARLFTNLLEAHLKVQQLAVTDELTGLSNRRAFDEMLKTEWQRARRDMTPISLAMLDIDRFKLLNDNFGHQAGDHCLAKLGLRFRESLFRPGDFIARYGGDEFAILLPNTDQKGAYTIIERIRQIIERAPILPNAKSREPITVSIGIATLSAVKSGDGTGLVSLADAALYAAKREGRNRTSVSTVDSLAPHGQRKSGARNL
jgi:diguanylate cyclase (GGDEF)-like protein